MHVSLNGISIHIPADLFPLLFFSGGVLLSRALSHAVRLVCVMLTLLENNWNWTEKGEQRAFLRLFWLGLDSKVTLCERTKSEPFTTQFGDHSGDLVSFLANNRQGCAEDRGGQNLLALYLLDSLKQLAVLLACFRVSGCSWEQTSKPCSRYSLA